MDRSEQALVLFSSEILVFFTTLFFGGVKIVTPGITVFGKMQIMMTVKHLTAAESSVKVFR